MYKKAIIIDCVGDAMSTLVNAINKTLPNLSIVGVSTNCKFGLSLAQKNKVHILFVRSKNNEYSELINKVKNVGQLPYIVYISEKGGNKSLVTNRTFYIDLKKLEHSLKILSNQFVFEELNGKSNRIGVPSSNGTTYIFTDQIIFCRSDNNYTIIYLESGEKIMVSKTLKKFELKLPNDTFLRTHQSYIVNLNKVNQICNKDGGFLTMNNNKKIPISRSKMQVVKKQLNYLFERI